MEAEDFLFLDTVYIYIYIYIYTNILTHIWRARGIQYRGQGEEPVVGLFSQIGDLYTVHHVWGKLFSPEWTVAALASFIRQLME